MGEIYFCSGVGIGIAIGEIKGFGKPYCMGGNGNPDSSRVNLGGGKAESPATRSSSALAGCSDDGGFDSKPGSIRSSTQLGGYRLVYTICVLAFELEHILFD